LEKKRVVSAARVEAFVRGEEKGVGVRVEEQRRKKSSRRAQLEPGGI